LFQLLRHLQLPRLYLLHLRQSQKLQSQKL
jgi:hypothetical protein